MDLTKWRVLDPMDRLSEVLFGLIMVLSITNSFSIAQAGKPEVKAMLIAALGCNIAWGVVDAVMYLLARLAEQKQKVMILHSVRNAGGPSEARRIISNALPEPFDVLAIPAEDAELRRRLDQLPDTPQHRGLGPRDWLGALAIFLLVFLSTLPVAVPFLFISEPKVALRVSNAVAIVMLFIMGLKLGRHAAYSALRMGLWMVLLGVALVVVTLALGG